MDAGRLTRAESACAGGKLCLVGFLMLAAAGCGAMSQMPSSSPTATPTPTPTPPPGAPKPLSTATITILASGFQLDPISAASFPLSDLHVYQGSQILFINSDTQTHDVLSDPFGAHNDCPELNTAGFLVPGQSRATTPLTVLRTCGFHDHANEGNAAFGGKVTIEAR